MSTSLVASYNERTALRDGLALLARILKLQLAVTWFFRLAALGLLADCFWLAASRFMPISVPAHALLIPPGVLAIAGLIISAFWRLPMEHVARRTDLALGLKERLTTALELQRRPEPHPLAPLQLRDTIDHVRRIEPLDAFPLRLPGRELQAIVVLSVLAALILAAPNPMERTVREREQIQKSVRQEAERLNRLADQVAAANLLDPTDELSSIERELREGARLLDERSGSGEESLAALSSIEQKLLGAQGAGSDELEDALASLAGSLAMEPSSRQLGTSLARGDYAQSADELRKLADRIPDMSAAERMRLARSMRSAGNRAARANPALGRSFSQSGDALEEGAEEQQSAALRDAAGQLESASGQLRAGGQRERALSQLQQSRSNVSRALQAARGRQAPGQAMPGQRAPSEFGGDYGSGAGEFDDEFGGDRPGGSSAGSGSANRSESVYDPLFTTGREDYIPGSDIFDPSEIYGSSAYDDAYRNEAQVGYQSVYANYQEKAVQSLQNSYIPVGLKDLVKDYFSSLAPASTK